MKPSKNILFLLVALLTFDVCAGVQEDLFKAAAQCDLAGVTKALDSGADINGLNEHNQNVLASSFFCPEVTQLLLDKGCDPNGGTYPAVVQAANNYSVDVLKMLLEAGADPNKPAVIDPGVAIRSLIEKEKAKGKKANKTTLEVWEGMLKNLQKSEINALQITVQQTNCAPCLELLIEHGADVKNAEKDGNLLHRLGAFSMTKEMRKSNFAQGKPTVESYGLKVPDWYGDLPDEVNKTSVDMLNVLVDAGLDVNAKRADGMTAFMVVLRQHKIDLAKRMLQLGADAVNQNDVTVGKITITQYPICVAAEFADKELMQLILDQKPDINVSVETKALGVTMNSDYGGNVTFGGDGYTPLIISIMSGSIDAANLLLDNGANIKIGSSGTAILKTKFSMLNCLTVVSKKTPIYWAVEQEDLELVERIGKMMEWKFNPDFTIKQYESGANFAGYKCASFKKKQSPSIYALTVGNKEAYKLLSAKGL